MQPDGRPGCRTAACVRCRIAGVHGGWCREVYPEWCTQGRVVHSGQLRPSQPVIRLASREASWNPQEGPGPGSPGSPGIVTFLTRKTRGSSGIVTFFTFSPAESPGSPDS